MPLTLLLGRDSPLGRAASSPPSVVLTSGQSENDRRLGSSGPPTTPAELPERGRGGQARTSGWWVGQCLEGRRAPMQRREQPAGEVGRERAFQQSSEDALRFVLR